MFHPQILIPATKFSIINLIILYWNTKTYTTEWNKSQAFTYYVKRNQAAKFYILLSALILVTFSHACGLATDSWWRKTKGRTKWLKLYARISFHTYRKELILRKHEKLSFTSKCNKFLPRWYILRKLYIFIYLLSIMVKHKISVQHLPHSYSSDHW